MYLVIFNKTGRPIYFGPFSTAKDARAFIDEDKSEHRSYMNISRMISHIDVRRDGGIDVVLPTSQMSKEGLEELVHKDIII